jgi:hypothetical protein
MRFFNAFVATPASPEGFTNFNQMRQVAEFIFAFDSNLKPIVGQQITLTPGTAATVGPRIDLMRTRAVAGECELIVKTQKDGDERGYYFNVGLGKYQSSVASAPNLTDSALRTQLINGGKPATYTCVPPGSGYRLGVDRDSDGYRDGDEIAACSDPADPNDTP